MRTRRLPSLIALASLAAALSVGTPARAADEAELKAAIVFNLLLFVEWPAEHRPGPGEPWVLCVSPSNAAADAMRRLSGRPLREAYLRLEPWPDSERAARCHAAFLSTADLDAGLPEPAARKGLLTITDVTPPHPPATVAITLRSNGSRLGFSLNLPVLKQSQLQPSLKLLRLAQGSPE